MAKTTSTYTALVGLNYTTAKGEVRVEAGKPCPDLPQRSVAWLLEQGLITDAAPAKAKPAATETTPGEADD